MVSAILRAARTSFGDGASAPAARGALARVDGGAIPAPVVRLAGVTRRFGTEVPLLGEIPLDLRLREGGDLGRPLVDADPEAPASMVFTDIAEQLTRTGRSLVGMQLRLTPTSKL